MGQTFYLADVVLALLELLGDFLVGFALGAEVENATLQWGQVMVVRPAASWDLSPVDQSLDEFRTLLYSRRDLVDDDTFLLHIEHPPLDGSQMFHGGGVAHGHEPSGPGGVLRQNGAAIGP